MTTREEQELKRLEVNVRRLIDKIEQQAQELASLRRLTQRQSARVQELEVALAEARDEASVARVAHTLGGGKAHSSEAYAYLSQVISEIESCIKQLEQD